MTHKAPSRHDAMVAGQEAIVRLAFEGHRGAAIALDRLEAAWEEAVGDDHPESARSEWLRALRTCIAKLGAEEEVPTHPPGECPDRYADLIGAPPARRSLGLSVPMLVRPPSRRISRWTRHEIRRLADAINESRTP